MEASTEARIVVRDHPFRRETVVDREIREADTEAALIRVAPDMPGHGSLRDEPKLSHRRRYNEAGGKALHIGLDALAIGEEMQAGADPPSRQPSACARMRN